jgi:CDP-paratose 2-epimerase
VTDRRQSNLITGGAGFIGANLADRLLGAGRFVTILDDFSRPGTDRNLEWLRQNHGDEFAVIRGSITDSATCERAVADAGTIFHLAGQTAVTTSVTDPRRDFEINAYGTLNILEAVRTPGHEPIGLYTTTNKV